MKRRPSLVPVLLVAVAACSGEGASPAEETTVQAAVAAGCPVRGSNGDGDAIDDGVEQCLLERYAPVAFLPLNKDWTRPANVDWFLARSTLRFHHNNCPDCSIIPSGPGQAALGQQSHQHRGGFLCRHSGTRYPSGSGDPVPGQQFFLQVLDDRDHAGPGNPADWRVYGHVYRNVLGGIDVQYWLFFAYNDNFAGFNHEGDWESVAVRLRGDGSVESAFYCEHGNCHRKEPWQVGWYRGTHPQVWIADGSHAAYESEAECDRLLFSEGGPDSCETSDDFRWFTWAGGRGNERGLQGGGVTNLGERGLPLDGQAFLHFNGRWGEIGVSDDTSGPIGPAYKDKWELGWNGE